MMSGQTLAACKVPLQPLHRELDQPSLFIIGGPSSCSLHGHPGRTLSLAYRHAERRNSGMQLVQRRRRLLLPSATGEESSSTAVKSPSEDDEDLEKMADIIRVLELLREKRDMTFTEVKLTVTIEDPREAERRRKLNLEDESGVSRDELAAALVDVNEGRIPEDRLALKVLHRTMVSWPNLDDATIEEEEELLRVMGRKGKSPSPYSASMGGGSRPAVETARAASQAWDEASDIEEVKGTEVDSPVPPVVGYSVLYVVSAIPIIIGVAVVIILFVNSLQ